MTKLHENYLSGTQITAGTGGGGVGPSGINDWTGRVNFALWDFPQEANIAFTSGTSNEILTATYTGDTHSYVQTMIYNAEINPVSVIVSGTSIGSTVEWVFFYQTNGSLATSTGGLVTGSVSLI